MKIKRFFAADMRSAMRQVKETLGSDAVILSNKPVEGGIELVAAKDYDEDAFYAETESAGNTIAYPVPEQRERPVKTERRPVMAAEEPEVVSFSSEAKSRLRSRLNEESKPAVDINREQASPRVELGKDPAFLEMQREMSMLRRMMENELSNQAWQETARLKPHSRDLMRRLMGLDVSPELCQALAARVEDETDNERAWRQVLGILADSVNVTGDEILEQGGAIALVGPTGVGKTTTVAKLAARYCLRHGNRGLALITTDNYRIGAQEQLHTYGRILDVPVRTVSTADELNNALSLLAAKDLILIDTAGMSQQDVRLSEQLAVLTAGHKPIRTLLTLSANTQLSALRQAVQKFKQAQPYACVLTKTDEAALLGGALSLLLQSGLPLAYITDGQKVPEDIHIARANSFVNSVVSLESETAPAFSEDYLALTFGGSKEYVHV